MINKSYITVKSSWGHEINNLYLTHWPKVDSIEIVANHSVSLHIIENAAHSLEIDDDYMESIHILSDVTNICANFVKKR